MDIMGHFMALLKPNISSLFINIAIETNFFANCSKKLNGIQYD